ncbi:unnamed protein product [Linum trigynum]|uniref:Uncharacterized protein n=1 Tax=Linum trigynum TaxID=586398 RepID=A0AAV2DTT8_9ROSI
MRQKRQVEDLHPDRHVAPPDQLGEGLQPPHGPPNDGGDKICGANMIGYEEGVGFVDVADERGGKVGYGDWDFIDPIATTSNDLSQPPLQSSPARRHDDEKRD